MEISVEIIECILEIALKVATCIPFFVCFIFVLKNQLKHKKHTNTKVSISYNGKRIETDSASLKKPVIFTSSKSLEALGKESSFNEHTNVIKDISVFKNMEDKDNDWLARQLREEYMLGMKNETDYGMQHEKHCNADALKEYHRLNCDADMTDTGEY